MSDDIYSRMYRLMHPKVFPRERQLELTDLWPKDQAEFKRKVDIIVKEAGTQINPLAALSKRSQRRMRITPSCRHCAGKGCQMCDWFGADQ